MLVLGYKSVSFAPAITANVLIYFIEKQIEIIFLKGKKDLREIKEVVTFADPKGSKFLDRLSTWWRWLQELRGRKKGKQKFSKNFQKTLARLKRSCTFAPASRDMFIMLIETRKNKKNKFLDILN